MQHLTKIWLFHFYWNQQTCFFYLQGTSFSIDSGSPASPTCLPEATQADSSIQVSDLLQNHPIVSVGYIGLLQACELVGGPIEKSLYPGFNPIWFLRILPHAVSDVSCLLLFVYSQGLHDICLHHIG